jgi:hypothetical protein
MYHFEDKRFAPVAISNSQVLPLVFAIVAFICLLSVTIIHAVVRRPKEWKYWKRSDKLIRETPSPLHVYIY